jgi:hypothetical protein
MPDLSTVESCRSRQREIIAGLKGLIRAAERQGRPLNAAEVARYDRELAEHRSLTVRRREAERAPAPSATVLTLRDGTSVLSGRTLARAVDYAGRHHVHRTALHEAAHLTVGFVLLGASAELTLRWRPDGVATWRHRGLEPGQQWAFCGGETIWPKLPELRYQADREARAAVHVAGIVAERELLGRDPESDSVRADWAAARSALRVSTDVQTWEAQRRASGLVHEERAAIEAVAGALIERGSLSMRASRAIAFQALTPGRRARRA